MSAAPLVLIVLMLAWLGTGLARRYALRRTVMDHPNERSLHSIATPRGGGIAITVLVLAIIFLLGYFDRLPASTVLALGGGGLLVGIIGWLDDQKGVPIVYRALVYFIASLWACYWVIADAGLSMTTAILIGMIGTFAITWLTNLYNFMDGSDGLAATEAICVTVVAALLLSPGHSGLSVLLWSLAAAAGGFLVWNWPPAKIFMGDTGSCFIGFMLGAIALYTSIAGILSLAVWLVLLSIFICDATLTLFKRAIGGEKWYQAHRQHAYQRFVLKTGSHQPLLYVVLLLNLGLVSPIAWLALTGGPTAWVMVAGLYALLGGVWLLVQLKYPVRENINNHS